MKTALRNWGGFFVLYLGIMRIRLIIIITLIASQFVFGQVKKAHLNKFEQEYTSWYLLNAKDTTEAFASDTLHFFGGLPFNDSLMIYPHLDLVLNTFSFSFKRLEPLVINNSCTSFYFTASGRLWLSRNDKLLLLQFYGPGINSLEDDRRTWVVIKELTYHITKLTKNSLILVRR
ncbi:MAG: hypothetical protein POELPBGB_03223 [Bacteroidia bacterium]|nr:hypothetical protein [Bacteroidia bacterium]